ncbi:hypothetical protein KC19_6G171200 [Ceratodon purpureus]|uniref:VWFA domain-containing protein n=1 Tax=Ceratodon purpureus TaxID=3225 RepID=A0A8T0HIK8_CERPU|nr:hypothetical protein KC19_6G171200 [Ceratodon purpureus]
MRPSAWCLVLLLFCVTLLGFPALMAGDEGSDFLDRKEQDVEKIVDQVVGNAGRQCELLAACDNPTSCSHDACSMEDTGGSVCMDVINNMLCTTYGTTDTPCKNINFDFGVSYVRNAESTNLNSVDTMLAICSQKPLEALFKTLSNATVLSRAYFGSITGSYRIYPGLPKHPDDCRKFDPRIRPWYRTSTSVAKNVVVLIDLAASMGNNLPPDLGAGTILEAAKKIAKELLTTLSAQDYVNIIVYDSSRVIQLSRSAVLVKEHNGTEAAELNFLRTELDKQTVEGQSRQSNISAAILAALPNFESNPQAAKVVIVITDGVFANFGNVSLPTIELSSSRVKVFIFKVKQPQDNDIFLKNNTLIQELCSVGGHFEPILKNLENPLLAFRQYFSYLASLKRILTNGRPQYSQVYEDTDATFGGNIITVAKPVFVEGALIGVAGITIYIEALGRITDQVKQALGSRMTGYSLAAPDVVLNAANCSLVSETLQPCGSSTAYYAQNGGMCKLRADSRKDTIQELLCCGNCSAPASSDDDKHQLSQGVIGGIVVGGIVGGVVGIGLLVFLVRWIKHNREGPFPGPFPGQDD